MKEKIYSAEIANIIKSYLKEDDWHFSFDEEAGLFRFGLLLSCKLKKINYIVDVNEDEYIVYAIAPIGVDKNDAKVMTAMSEFICRANYGLKNGNFELDMSNGEVSFKIFVDCEGITPSKDIVENSIHCPAAMFERYGSGIVDIIFGNVTAKDAVEQCEKPVEEFADLLKTILLQKGTSDLDDTDIVSRLIELAEGDRELEGKLSRLIEISDSLVLSDEGKQSSDIDKVPTLLKTDLFGTEGDND